MRRWMIVAAVLLCLPVWSEAQSCDGCGIGYRSAAVTGLSSSGTEITSTLPILLPDGSCASPALAFASEPGLGFYRSGAAIMQVCQNGFSRAAISSSYVAASNDNSYLGLGNALDVRMYRGGGANILQLGVTASTASAQTFKAPDSTGAATAGGSLTLKGGAGTSGNANGGQLILQGGANAGSGEPGAVAIADGGTKPTCAAGIRGSIWYDAGGAGVADTFEVCAKQAAGDSYAWRVLATIP